MCYPDKHETEFAPYSTKVPSPKYGWLFGARSDERVGSQVYFYRRLKPF